MRDLVYKFFHCVNGDLNSEITEPLFVYADSLPYNATRLVRYRYNNANAPRGSNGIALINTVGNSKNIHAFIVGEGRTIAYSVKKENGWGEWAFFVPSSDLGIVIKNSGTVAAVANADVQIATITLPANHKYLILAHTRSTQGFEAVGAIMSCSIKKISGTTNSTVGTGTTRTLMDYGGGCTAWGIVDTSTSCVYGLFGYGYYSAQYNYAGEICAIQLA